MRAYLSPEKPHGWSVNWAFDTNVSMVPNLAAFNGLPVFGD